MLTRDTPPLLPGRPFTPVDGFVRTPDAITSERLDDFHWNLQLIGTLAFLLNYVPILGPVTGVVIFFFVGIFAFPSIWQAFIPASMDLGIHILEGETITPLLLARRFTLKYSVVAQPTQNAAAAVPGRPRRFPAPTDWPAPVSSLQ